MTPHVAFGNFHLSVANRSLWHKGAPVALKPKEIEVLSLLAERRPEIVQREELIDHIWGGTASDAALDQTMYRLRRALSRYEIVEHVRTIPGVGFQLVGSALVDDTKDHIDGLRRGFKRFQRAMFLLRMGGRSNVLRAILLLEHVCDGEPEFVAAFVLLARAHMFAGERFYRPGLAALWQSRVSIERAIAADGSSAEAYAALALFFLFFKGDTERARLAAERSLLLQPSSAVAREAAFWERLARSDIPAALAHADAALSANPASGHATSLLGIALYVGGDHAAALDVFATALHLDPRCASSHFYTACIHMLASRFDAAEYALSQIDDSQRLPRHLALQGILHAKRGQIAQAEHIWSLLSDATIPAHLSIAAVEAALGRRADSERSLRRSIESREPGVFFGAIDPLYAGLLAVRELVTKINARQPRSCDRCGTHIEGREAELWRVQFCFRCRGQADALQYLDARAAR